MRRAMAATTAVLTLVMAAGCGLYGVWVRGGRQARRRGRSGGSGLTSG